MRLSIGRSAITALVLMLVLGTAAHAQRTFEELDLVNVSSISPSPVVIGARATLRGRGFGEPGSLDILLVDASAWAQGIPIGARHVLSWNDTRIELMLPIDAEGRFGLQLFRRSGEDPGDGIVFTAGQSGISFDAVLPTPTIRGYSASLVCPGQPFSLRGSGFTTRRGRYSISWEKTSGGSTPIRDNAVNRWADDEIRFTAPRNRFYATPGMTVRLKLYKTGERTSQLVATGPVLRVADCEGGAPTDPGPSVEPSQRRALERPVTPGRELRPSPALSTQAELHFRLAPVQRSARVGDSVAFGGSFEAPRELARVLGSDPAQVEWTILRDDAIVASQLVHLRDARTPWLQRVRADRPGTYRLQLRLLHGPRGLIFRSELSAAKIVVSAPLPQADRDKIQQPQRRPGPAPTPRRLEPIRP